LCPAKVTVSRAARAEERTALGVRGMTGYAETATRGLCGDRLSEGRTACRRVREEGRCCGGDIDPPQRTREPGRTRVDPPERERDGAAARPRWRMLRSVDAGGTAGVLRRAEMMAPCREGARQERRHEEEREEVTRRAQEREDRVCAAFGCTRQPHLTHLTPRLLNQRQRPD
jgi:hypothetical protein